MAGQLTIDTLKASSGVLATQNGMTGIAKAWVKFAGGASPSITNSFNVSSVTLVSTGIYTVTFTTAMPSADYTPVVSGSINTATNSVCTAWPYGDGYTAPSASAFNIGFVNQAQSKDNPKYGLAAVFA